MLVLAPGKFAEAVEPADVRVAVAVHGDGAAVDAVFTAGAAQIRAVDQGAARGVDLGDEGVDAATVQRLKRVTAVGNVADWSGP